MTTAAFAQQPTIAPYFNDKRAALSFTFDDGFISEVDDALTVLDPLGIQGTFFIIPLRIENPEDGNHQHSIGWEKVRVIQATGHEIGTHNAVAPKLHEVAPENLPHHLIQPAKLIEQHVGIRPFSYAIPGGSRLTPEIEALVYKQHYLIRGQPLNQQKPHTVLYGNTEHQTWNAAGGNQRLDQAIERGEWLVPIIHGISGGYAQLGNRDVFRDHCEHALSRQDELWIAPLGVVGRYVLERDAAQLENLRQSEGSLSFKLTHTLPDKNTYDHPLTIIVTAKDATKARAQLASGEELDCAIKDGKILINVVPDGTPVTVSW